MQRPGGFTWHKNSVLESVVWIDSVEQQSLEIVVIQVLSTTQSEYGSLVDPMQNNETTKNFTRRD